MPAVLSTVWKGWRPYRTLLEPMWQEAQDGNVTIVSSPLLVLEALVKPLRDGDTGIESQYRELFASNAVRLLDASYQVFAGRDQHPCRDWLKNTGRDSRRYCTTRRVYALRH